MMMMMMQQTKALSLCFLEQKAKDSQFLSMMRSSLSFLSTFPVVIMTISVVSAGAVAATKWVDRVVTLI